MEREIAHGRAGLKGTVIDNRQFKPDPAFMSGLPQTNDGHLGLLILWHSRTGAARALAQAAASAAGSTARLIEAEDAQPADFLSAGGYLFICPENLAAMSGAMKEMFDRCYYPLLGRIEGRAYATIIAAGSDGTGATAQIDRIVTGWRLRRVNESVIINMGAQRMDEILAPKTVNAQDLQHCAELAGALVEGLAMGIF